jgi:hypothetical protein
MPIFLIFGQFLIMKNRNILVLTFLFLGIITPAQTLQKDKNYYLSAIGFWNVENLYDTLNDQWKNDEDYTPVGIYAWNGKRYRTKIEHLSDAIAQMATDVTPDGLAILGLSEIENKSVVQDLVNATKLFTSKDPTREEWILLLFIIQNILM